MSTVVAMDAPIAAVLNELGDETKAFHAHVTTLSNPFFEGRAPGTAGIEYAADYLEHYFRYFDLEPVFDRVIETPDGSEVVERSHRQTFEVSGEPVIETARLRWRSEESSVILAPEIDFDPTPLTGSGAASGTPVFIGYAIESGPDGYTSFEDDPDLTGAIAVMLRFEPMDAQGKSLWAESGRWSNNAGLTPKIRAATQRGAETVIIINPPGADDPRAGELFSARDSRFGGRGQTPVLNMTPDAAERLLRDADPQGRSLMELRRLADRGAHGAIRLDGVELSVEAQIKRQTIPTDNVAGLLRGRGDLANEYIVIGAHYDHVGHGEFGSRSPGRLHPGADDNASGTGGVLLAAQKLSAIYEDMPEDAEARSIIFIGFTAEEMGLLGSRHFVNEPPVALSQIVAMLNMDMIGRLRGGALEVLGVGTGDQFETIMTSHIERSGMSVTLSRMPGGRSDHAPFSDEGVPAMAFFTGLHPDYHAPGDVASRVHFKGGAQVADLVATIALDLAARPERVRFVETRADRQEQGGPRLSEMTVRLGIAPGNYGGDEPGVVVGGVSEGTSAAEAGLQEDDRIVRWNGEELLDIRGMMRHLAAAKPGDVASLIVVRDGEEIEINVTLKARGGAS